MAGNDSFTQLNVGTGGDNVRDLTITEDGGTNTKQQVITLGSPESESTSPAYYSRLAAVNPERRALQVTENETNGLLRLILGELRALNILLSSQCGDQLDLTNPALEYVGDETE